MLVTELAAEDYESVDRAGRILHERGWRAVFSLNEMMAAWAELVAAVEDGYDELADEYTNDLACRDWLAQAWPLLTARIRAARQVELDRLDARFREASTDDGGEALGRFRRLDASDGWWWRRLPLRREGEFARDMNG